MRAREKGQGAPTASATASSRLYRALLNSTLAAGIMDAANVIGKPTRYAKQWLRRFASGHVPNALRSPLRNADDHFRDPDSHLPESAGQGERAATFLRRTAEEALPLSSIQQPPIVNVWGRRPSATRARWARRRTFSGAW